MKQLEKYYINFDELKVGDTVWHNTLGEVEIPFIDNNSKEYPIVLPSGSYTKDGKFRNSNKYPSIYKSNPFLDLKEEPRMIEVLCGDIWKEKELIKIINRVAVYWNDDNKEYAYSAPFYHWREIQPKELTDKERIAELEKEVEKLKNKVNGKIL